MLSKHCDNATDDDITQNISIFHGLRDQSHIIHDTNNTSRRDPINHHSKSHTILINFLSSICCFLQPIISVSFALHPVLLCAFSFHLSPIHLCHGLFPSPDPKTPTMTLCAQLLFQIAKPHHVSLPKHLACLSCRVPSWPAVKYAKYVSSPCMILRIVLQFCRNLDHRVMCDAVLSSGLLGT